MALDNSHIWEVAFGIWTYHIIQLCIQLVCEGIRPLTTKIEALTARIREKHSVKAPSIKDPPIHDPEDK